MGAKKVLLLNSSTGEVLSIFVDFIETHEQFVDHSDNTDQLECQV